MHKILFLVPYPFDKAPSQRLKFEQYFSIFESNGYQITFKSYINKEFWKIVHRDGFFAKKIFLSLQAYLKFFFLLATLRKYDIVYSHLWITPFGMPFFEWLVYRISKKIIYDIDDLVYIKNLSTPGYLKLLKGYSKPVFLMKNADHVITCTPYLDEFVKKYNSNTTDISSTVDTNFRYLPVNVYNNSNPIIVGWSGSHSTIRHLLIIQNVFKIIQKKYPQIVFKVMGGKVAIEGVNIESIDWNEDIEIETLQTFDIGIYPLPNEEWVYGKSGLKAIQYMALGIPTIATAIGTNFRVIEDGVTGFLVATDEEWVEKLSLLIENPDLRKKIGLGGRQKVENEFSLKANAQKYLDVFTEVLNK